MQFIHQMFNVSALLLDDAFLKCVVTKVVLLAVVAFKSLTCGEHILHFRKMEGTGSVHSSAD